MAVNTAEVRDNFIKAVQRRHPDRIPVASCTSMQYLCARFRVNLRDYFYDTHVKLKVQCAFQEEHPDMLLVPGIYTDFGCDVAEPSAFGCELVQTENDPLSPK